MSHETLIHALFQKMWKLLLNQIMHLGTAGVSRKQQATEKFYEVWCWMTITTFFLLTTLIKKERNMVAVMQFSKDQQWEIRTTIVKFLC